MLRKFTLQKPMDIIKQLEYAIALAHKGDKEMPKARLIVSACKHAAQAQVIDIMQKQFIRDAEGLPMGGRMGKLLTTK